MARVNVDAQVHTDPRFDLLGMALFPRAREYARDLALGLMTRVWSFCAHREGPDAAILRPCELAILLKAPEPKAMTAVEMCGLFEPQTDGRWRVRGCAGRTDYLAAAKDKRKEAILAAVEEGHSTPSAVAKAVGGNRNAVFSRIKELEASGDLTRVDGMLATGIGISIDTGIDTGSSISIDTGIARRHATRGALAPVLDPALAQSESGARSRVDAAGISGIKPDTAADTGLDTGSDTAAIPVADTGSIPGIDTATDTDTGVTSPAAPTIQALSETDAVISTVHGRSLCMPALLEYQHELRRRVDPECRRVPVSTGHDVVMQRALARFAPSHVVHALTMFGVEAQLVGHLKFFDGRRNWELASIERMVALTEKDLRAAHRERQRGRPEPDEPPARKMVRL